jgi:hypothetical protein
LEFIIIADGKIVGQVFWDGVGDPPVPPGAALVTIAQAIDLRLGTE